MATFSSDEIMEPSKLGIKSALRICKDTTDIDVIIDLTKHQSPQVRQNALRQMCPCRVKKDITDFWNRVLEMVNDPDSNVSGIIVFVPDEDLSFLSQIKLYQVLHTLCDGSPQHLEDSVALALDQFNRDPSLKIRRQAHKALSAYWRTGKWNIL